MYGFARVTTPNSTSDTTYFLSMNEILYVRLVEESDSNEGIVLSTASETEGTAVFFKNGSSIMVNEAPEEIFSSVVFVSAPSFVAPTTSD